MLMVFLGLTRRDGGASVQMRHTGETGEVLPCVTGEVEVEMKEQTVEFEGQWCAGKGVGIWV